MRYLVRDDPDQAARAASLIDGTPVWLSLTVALECECVLRSSYGLQSAAIVVALRTFMGQPTVQVENPEALARALDWCAQGMDFADALHVCVAREAQSFRTFDARLVKQAARAGLAQLMEL